MSGVNRPLNVFYDEIASPESVAILREEFGTGYRVTALERDDPAEERARCAEADLILAGWRPLRGEMICAADRARLIHKMGAGVDTIDLATAAACGIPVTRAAGMNAVQVAEHTVMLALALLRRVCVLDRSLRAGQWLKNEARPTLHGLAGRCVGVVGLGAIGSIVAQRFGAFDTTVVYSDTHRAGPERERELGVVHQPLDALLERADILTLHVPLGDDTRKMIGREQLRRMRPGALIINVARGGVLDYGALAESLAGGHLGGAALDVFETEPPDPRHPLFQRDDVIVTPHVGGSSRAGLQDLAGQARAVFERALSGLPLPGEMTLPAAVPPKLAEPDV